MEFIHLRQNEDLERLLHTSRIDPVIIFKHSTQCWVSAQAYKEFDRFAEAVHDVPCGIVLVIEHRSISNAIASGLGVRHESPQAIVVEDRRSVWSASHWEITAEALEEALRR